MTSCSNTHTKLKALGVTFRLFNGIKDVKMAQEFGGCFFF